MTPFFVPEENAGGNSVMAKERLVVIGNGMAGIRTVEELLKLVPSAYDITGIG